MATVDNGLVVVERKQEFMSSMNRQIMLSGLDQGVIGGMQNLFAQVFDGNGKLRQEYDLNDPLTYSTILQVLDALVLQGIGESRGAKASWESVIESRFGIAVDNNLSNAVKQMEASANNDNLVDIATRQIIAISEYIVNNKYQDKSLQTKEVAKQ
jgi:hypothetical protein